jgi:hypothetical protein
MLLDSGIDCLHWIWAHIGGTGKGVPTAKAKAAKGKGKERTSKGAKDTDGKTKGTDEHARIFDPTASSYGLPVAGEGHIPSTVQYGGPGANTLHIGAAALLDGTGAKVFAFTQNTKKEDEDEEDASTQGSSRVVKDPILHPGNTGVDQGLHPHATGREKGRREWRLHIYYAAAHVSKRMLAHNRQAVDHVLKENLAITERARCSLHSRKIALDRSVMKMRVCAARLPYVQSKDVRSLRQYLEKKRDRPQAQAGRLSSDPPCPMTASGRPATASTTRPPSATTRSPGRIRPPSAKGGREPPSFSMNFEQESLLYDETPQGDEQDEYRTLVAELLERLLHAFCLLKNAPPDEATALMLLGRCGHPLAASAAASNAEGAAKLNADGSIIESEMSSDTAAGAFNKPVFLLDIPVELASVSASSPASSSQVLGVSHFLVSSSVLGFLERHFLSHPSLDVSTLERLQNVGALDPGVVSLCKWIRFAYVFGTFAHEHRVAHARRVDSLIRHTRLAYHTSVLMSHSRWHLSTTHALLRGIVRWDEKTEEKIAKDEKIMRHRELMVEEAIKRDAAGALAMPKARVPDWTNDWFECLLKHGIGCGERHEQVVAGIGLSLAESSSQLRPRDDNEEQEEEQEVSLAWKVGLEGVSEFTKPNGTVENVALLKDRVDDYDGEGPEGETEDPTVDPQEDWAGVGLEGEKTYGTKKASPPSSPHRSKSSPKGSNQASEGSTSVIEEMVEGEELEDLAELLDGDESKSKPPTTFALCVVEPGAFAFRTALQRHRWTVRSVRKQRMLGHRTVKVPMSPSRSILARTRKLDEENVQAKRQLNAAKEKVAETKLREENGEDDEDYDGEDDNPRTSSPVNFAEARRKKKAQAEAVRQKAEMDKRAEKRKLLGRPISRSVTAREWLRGSLRHLQGGKREPHASFVVDLLPRPAGAEYFDDEDEDEDEVDEDSCSSASSVDSSRRSTRSMLSTVDENAQNSEGGQQIIDGYLGVTGGAVGYGSMRPLGGTPAIVTDLGALSRATAEWGSNDPNENEQRLKQKEQRKWHQNRWLEQQRLGMVAFTFEFRKLPAVAMDLITMQLGIRGLLPSSQTFVERTILAMPRLPPPNASFNGYDNNSNAPALVYPTSVTNGPSCRSWVEALSNDVDDWLEEHESSRRAAEDATLAAGRAARAAVQGSAYALKQAAIRFQTAHLLWFRKRYDAIETRTVAEKEALKYKYDPAEQDMDWKQQRAAEGRRDAANKQLRCAKVPLPGVENEEASEMRCAAAHAAEDAKVQAVAKAAARTKAAAAGEDLSESEDEEAAIAFGEATKEFLTGWCPPAAHDARAVNVIAGWKRWPVAQLRTLATKNEVGTMHCKNKGDIIRELVINGADFPRDKKNKLFKKTVVESGVVPLTHLELEVVFGWPQPPHCHLEWVGFKQERSVPSPSLTTSLKIVSVGGTTELEDAEDEEDETKEARAKAEAETKAEGKAAEEARAKAEVEARAEAEKKAFIHGVSGKWIVVTQTDEEVKLWMIAEGLIEKDHEEEEAVMGEHAAEAKAKLKAKQELKLHLMIAVTAAKGAAESAKAISDATMSMAKWPQLYGLLGLDVDEMELGTTPQEFYRSDDIVTAYRQACWTLQAGKPLYAVHHEINENDSPKSEAQQKQQLQQLRSRDKEKKRQSVIQGMDFTLTAESRRRSSIVPEGGRNGPRIGMRDIALAISVLGSDKYRRAFHWMFKWRARRVLMLLRRGRWPPPKIAGDDDEEVVDETVQMLAAMGLKVPQNEDGKEGAPVGKPGESDEVATTDANGNPITHGWYWNEHQFAGMDGDDEPKLCGAVTDGFYDLVAVTAGEEVAAEAEQAAEREAATAAMHKAAKAAVQSGGRAKAAKSRVAKDKKETEDKAKAKAAVAGIGEKKVAANKKKKQEKDPIAPWLHVRINEASEWAQSLKELEISSEGVFIESEDNDSLSSMVERLRRPFPRTLEATWYVAGYFDLLEPQPWQQRERERARHLQRQRRKRLEQQRRQIEQQQRMLLRASERTSVATRLRDSLPVMERRPPTPDQARAALKQLSPEKESRDGGGGSHAQIMAYGDATREDSPNLLIRRVDVLHELEHSRFTPSAAPPDPPALPLGAELMTSAMAVSNYGLAPGVELHPALMSLAPQPSPSQLEAQSQIAKEPVCGFRHVVSFGGTLGLTYGAGTENDVPTEWARHRMAADAMQLALLSGIAEKWCGDWGNRRVRGNRSDILSIRRLDWRVPQQRVWLLPDPSSDPKLARRLSYLGAMGKDTGGFPLQAELGKLKPKAGMNTDDEIPDAGKDSNNLLGGIPRTAKPTTISTDAALAIVPKLPLTIAERGLEKVLASDPSGSGADASLPTRGSQKRCGRYFSPPPTVLTMVMLAAVERSHAIFKMEEKKAAECAKAEKAALKASRKSSSHGAGLKMAAVKAKADEEKANGDNANEDKGGEGGEGAKSAEGAEAPKGEGGEVKIVLTRAQIAAKHMGIDGVDGEKAPVEEKEEKEDTAGRVDAQKKSTFKASDWAPEFGIASAPHLTAQLLNANFALLQVSLQDLEKSPVMMALLHGCQYKRQHSDKKPTGVGGGIIGEAVGNGARNYASVEEEANKLEEQRRAAAVRRASIGVGKGMDEVYEVSKRHEKFCRSWRGRREKRLRMRWDRQHTQNLSKVAQEVNAPSVSFKVAGVGGRRSSTVFVQEGDGEDREDDDEEAAAASSVQVKAALKYADALRRENMWGRREARMENEAVQRTEAWVSSTAILEKEKWMQNSMRSIRNAAAGGSADGDEVTLDEENAFPPPPRPLALLLYAVHVALTAGVENGTNATEGVARMPVPLVPPAPASAWEQLEQAENKIVANIIRRKEEDHAVQDLDEALADVDSKSTGGLRRNQTLSGPPKRLSKRAELDKADEHFLGLDHEGQGGTHQAVLPFAAPGASSLIKPRTKTKSKLGAAAAATRAAASLLGGISAPAPPSVHSTAAMYGKSGSGSTTATGGMEGESDVQRDAQAAVQAQMSQMASMQADDYEDVAKWKWACHASGLRSKEIGATGAVWKQLREIMCDPKASQRQSRKQRSASPGCASTEEGGLAGAERESFAQYAHRESFESPHNGGGRSIQGLDRDVEERLCDEELRAIELQQQRCADSSFEERELAEYVAAAERPRPQSTASKQAPSPSRGLRSPSPVVPPPLSGVPSGAEGRPNMWEYVHRPARRTRYLAEVLQQMTRFNPLFIGYHHCHTGTKGADSAADEATASRVAYTSEKELPTGNSAGITAAEVLALVAKDSDIANRAPLEPFGPIAMAIRQWLLAVVAMREAHAQSAKVVQAEMHKLGASAALVQLEEQWWREHQRYVEPAVLGVAAEKRVQSPSPHSSSRCMQAETTSSSRPQESRKPKEECRGHLLREYQAHLSAVVQLLGTKPKK